jgi:hypothetical protein
MCIGALDWFDHNTDLRLGIEDFLLGFDNIIGQSEIFMELSRFEVNLSDLRSEQSKAWSSRTDIEKFYAIRKRRRVTSPSPGCSAAQ